MRLFLLYLSALLAPLALAEASDSLWLGAVAAAAFAALLAWRTGRRRGPREPRAELEARLRRALWSAPAPGTREEDFLLAVGAGLAEALGLAGGFLLRQAPGWPAPELHPFGATTLPAPARREAYARLVPVVGAHAVETHFVDDDRAVLVVALQRARDPYGAFLFPVPPGAPAPGAFETELLESVATQLAVRLENRALRHSVRVDPLTRLYNRSYLFARLREETQRGARSGRPFSFLMLDVDHFKRVNDTYGHPAGDELLVAVAALLRRSSRNTDAVGRYGGEEFGILLVDTPRKGAEVFAENLRRAVAEETFRVAGEELRITVSLGVAEWREGTTAAELVRRADRALYDAKSAGRNAWRAFNESGSGL